MAEPSRKQPALANLFSQLKKSLSFSATFLFGVITLVSASCAGLDYFLISRETAASTLAQAEQTNTAGRLLELVALQKQIEIDVIQVQQYLSDYAATRGQDGADDGLENADKFAKRFPLDVAAAKESARAIGSPDVVEALTTVAGLFPEFYQRGQEMAKVYAASGVTAGNRLMKEFDRISDDLQARVELINQTVETAKRRSEEKSVAEIKKINWLREIASRFSILSIFIVTFTCLISVIIVRKWLVEPLSWITFAFRELSKGNMSLDADKIQRADELGALARAYADFRETALERRKLARESRLLAEFGAWLQGCKSLDELYDMTATFLTVLLPECAGALYVYAHSRDVLDNQKVWNGAVERPPIQPDDCWSLRRGRTFTHGDNEVEFHCAHVDAKMEDYCCIPIVAHGETIGMLHLELRSERAASDKGRRKEIIADQRRLGMICGEQISMSIANVKLRDQLRDQTIRDPLTGLFNRRYLMDTLRREISRARRNGQAVSLLSLDVDHFKQFNDNHGHDAGDMVLRAVGDCLQATFRDEDFACRFGGEEFIVVLPGAAPDVAARRAEELRSSIESIHVRYLERTLPRISISVGVAAFPNSGDNPQAIVRAADEALYAAKQRGRNRVEPAASLQSILEAATGLRHALEAGLSANRREPVSRPAA